MTSSQASAKAFKKLATRYTRENRVDKCPKHRRLVAQLFLSISFNTPLTSVQNVVAKRVVCTCLHLETLIVRTVLLPRELSSSSPKQQPAPARRAVAAGYRPISLSLCLSLSLSLCSLFRFRRGRKKQKVQREPKAVAGRSFDSTTR
jgi:hypothetical protein